MRVECEGGVLLDFQGPWWHQGCRDRDFPNCKCYGLVRVFFQASCSWWSGGLFGQSFSVAPPIQEFWGLPCLAVLLCCSACQDIQGHPVAGVLLYRLVHQSLKGAPWVGSYSVVQCVRHLMGQSLHCSAANAGMWGERGYCDVSTPYMWLNIITLLPRLPNFPPKAFPITIFSLPSPPSVTLQSTVTFALRSLHTTHTPAPSRCTFQRTLVSVRGMYGCGKDVWFSSHLGCHRSAVSLSALNVSPLTQKITPMWGLDPCFSSPTHWGQVHSC